MSPLAVGDRALAVPGADLGDGPAVLLVYKVTCPTCQMSAPPAERLFQAFPDRFVAVAQDPPDRIEDFNRDYGTTFDSVPDAEPYPVSDAYGIRTVPTLFLINEGRAEDVVESWDREGWNRVAARLAELTGDGAEAVSEEGDGLPPFRPG